MDYTVIYDPYGGWGYRVYAAGVRVRDVMTGRSESGARAALGAEVARTTAGDVDVIRVRVEAR